MKLKGKKMTKKKKVLKQAVEGEKSDEKNALDILTKDGLFSEAVNSVVQYNFSDAFGKRNVGLIHEHLKIEGKKVNNGNLESVERMLIVQAHTLDTIFNNLATRASGQSNLDVFETLIRLAFKAQSQCRTTLETLANIKNPFHVAFVKQANIGHNQQVNNSVAMPSEASHTREIKKQQNQLLEESHGEQLDTRAKGSAINLDKKLGAMEKVHRPKKS